MQGGYQPYWVYNIQLVCKHKKRNLNINFLHINKADSVFYVDLFLSWVVVTFRINIVFQNI